MTGAPQDPWNLEGKQIEFQDEEGNDVEGKVISWHKQRNTYTIKCRDGRELEEVIVAAVDERVPAAAKPRVDKWYFMKLDEEPSSTPSGDMCGKCAACKKGKDSKQQCLMSSVRWLADRKVYSALVAEMGANAIGARVQVLWQQGPQQWFVGTVSDYDEVNVKHQIIYDDGDVSNAMLTNLMIRPIDPEDLKPLEADWMARDELRVVDIEGECCFGSRVLGEAACGEQVLIFAGDRIQEGTLERWIPEKRTHVAMIKSKEVPLNYQRHVVLRRPKTPDFPILKHMLAVNDTRSRSFATNQAPVEGSRGKRPASVDLRGLEEELGQERLPEHTRKQLKLIQALRDLPDDADGRQYTKVSSLFEQFCMTHPCVPKDTQALWKLYVAGRDYSHEALESQSIGPAVYFFNPLVHMMGLSYEDLGDIKKVQKVMDKANGKIRVFWLATQGIFNSLMRREQMTMPREPIAEQRFNGA